MKQHAKELRFRGFPVSYLEHTELADTASVAKRLVTEGILNVTCYDVADDWLRQALEQGCHECDLSLTWLESPQFLVGKEWFQDFFQGRSYAQTPFYRALRSRFDILLDNGKPVGGKWTYDVANRKKMPKGKVIPTLWQPATSEYVVEARAYVAQHFSQNPGRVDSFFYPVSREGAQSWLEDFLTHRFADYGTYQDAMVSGASFLFHSLLSPLLNSGLLTPKEVIDSALDFASAQKIPLNSLEGFIRQILGWREYMRAVYELKGRFQRTHNYWDFTAKMPPGFWRGNTGIIPIDEMITRLLATGYGHHIERLMILGNFMLLCELDPDEVHAWFMALFIDAYDWVMVPNVYGMSQYADGGLTTTKPYISSSNYLRKMSNYPKGEWCEIWDGLYWRFMARHQKRFEDNPRMGMMLRLLAKMDSSVLRNHQSVAEQFLTDLYGS